MSRAADIARRVATSLTAGAPALHGLLRGVRERLQVAHHALGSVAPVVIRPRTVNVTVALTARCNQRCAGCLYERGFMAGAALSRELLDDLVDDAALLGVRSLRLYGGEPLLHPDLARVVARAAAAGLDPYVTTNGVLLDERIDELVAAGLRQLTFGFYGVGKAYDDYVERPGNYERLERGIAAVRERHGDRVRMRMNWLLMRPTCSVEAADAAVAFARRYDTPIQVDLVHYSLPYFTEGADRELAFRAADRAAIERVVERLLQWKAEAPHLIENSEIGLRSIPDWLLRGAAMRVPCDKYRMVWVGADGTVQLCYVTFRLGRLGGQRLRDLLYTPEHTAAARAAFRLECPNCHCGYDERARKHLPTRLEYGRAP